MEKRTDNIMHEPLNEEIDENMSNMVYLTDEDGNQVPFEFLDLIDYRGNQYVVLFPPEEMDDSGEVVILRVDDSDPDSDEESYLAVEDEATLAAVYDIFRERFKDVFQFDA